MSLPDTLLKKLIDDCNVHQFTLTYNGWNATEWICDLLHDRVTFSGTGSSAEEALVEAIVDRGIGDFYYYADMGGPALTPEQLNARLQDTYQSLLGYAPGHAYRGEYAES